MSRSLPLRWLHRLGALTTALLMLPASSIFASVQASPRATYTNKTCDRLGFLQPDDLEVRSLRLLANRYKTSLAEESSLTDPSISRRQFEQMSEVVFRDIFDKARYGVITPLAQDIQALQWLNLPKDASNGSIYSSLLKYLQALLPLTRQQAAPEEIKILQTLSQQYQTAQPIKERMNRYEFAIALYAVLTKIRYGQPMGSRAVLSDQDLSLVQQLLKTAQADIVTVYGEADLDLNYFQVLQRLKQETVSSDAVQELQAISQRLNLPSIDLNRDRPISRYDFLVALNNTVQQIQWVASVPLSQQDQQRIQSLLDQFKTDLSSLGFIQNFLATRNISVNGPVSDADIQELRALNQRYGRLISPTSLFSSYRPNRYEFAAALNIILDRVNELVAVGNLSNLSALTLADLATLQRLQEGYSAELAILRGRVDALEARTTELESQQFSTQPPISIQPSTPPSSAGSITINQSALAPSAQPNSNLQTSTQLSGETVFPISGSTQPGTAAPPFTDESRIHPPGTANTEGYNPIDENPFQLPGTNPLSTFSIDVDTASYSNVRRFISQGQLPPKDAVRIEELINYFPYDYPQPQGDQPFSITTEVAAAPWNAQHKLVQIGLKGKQLEQLQPSNLVFLVDVSGSMAEPNKLPLVKQSLCLLVKELTAQDRVTLVVYAGNAGLVLPPTPGNQKDKIMDAIERLEAGGSTAGGAGIELAYSMAQQNFLKDGNNRVILATDGDFNVGVSSDGELVRLIEQKRDKGVFLTVLGFGTGNYKDSKMEQLANKGNGNYAYIDTLLEARKVLVQDLRATLFTIAKDVKIQVEFNPTRVQAYRLIGYENRLLKDQDFNDDRKDAGEIGAGHTVTALYEVIPTGVESEVKLPTVDPLRYQQQTIATTAAGAELMQVKLRYKHPKDASSQLISQPVLDRNTPTDQISPNLKFSSAVALFGMMLRQSDYAGTANFDTVLKLATQAKGNDPDGYRSEFIRLVERCKVLIAQAEEREARDDRKS